jgi:hypothetical protein
MPQEDEQIRTQLMAFIAFLRAVEHEECGHGAKAAQNLEQTLRLFETEPAQGKSRLAYDVGGKGVLDWQWSDRNLPTIEKFCEQLGELAKH